jgi:hypothetical protein
MAHPDDAAGSKYALICAGIPKLAEKNSWNLDHVYLWLDFSGIEQDNIELLLAGVQSLRGYVSLCDALLIPSPEVPLDSKRSTDTVGGQYGQRAWTLLESMSFYTVSFYNPKETKAEFFAAHLTT